LETEAFHHSILFIEGQNKKNEEIKELKDKLNKIEYENNQKFDILFKAMNLSNEEEEKVEPNIEPLPIRKQSPLKVKI